MDVRCERCQTEYELPDSSISEEGTPVQCSACGHTFPVAPARPPVATPDDEVAPPVAEWLLETSEGGPLRFRNLTSLQRWIVERKVTRDDRISRTGQAWRRLGEIVELTAFFDVVDEADRARAAERTARDLWEQSQRGLTSAAAAAAVPEERTAAVRARRWVGPAVVVGVVAAAVAAVGIGSLWQREQPPPATAPAPAPLTPPPATLPRAPAAAAELAPPLPPAAPPPAVRPRAESPSYDRMVAEADRLLENGAPVQAQRLYDRALKLRPAGAEALAGLGYVALDHNHNAEAGLYFRRSLEARSSFGPALFGLAETQRNSGEVEGALEHYRRYLAVDPAGADAPAARRHVKMLEADLGVSARAAPPPSSPP